MSLSFKIEAPTSHKANQTAPRPTSSALTSHPKSRTFNGDFGSSEDEDAEQAGQRTRRPELITQFDSTRPTKNEKRPELLIPALPDRDFRAIHVARKAKRAKKELYKPEAVNSFGTIKTTDSSTAVIDPEGVDKINSTTISGGLEVRQQPYEKVNPLEVDSPATQGGGAVTPLEKLTINCPTPVEAEKPDTRLASTLEEKAFRELISQAGGSLEAERPEIQAIVMSGPTASDSDSDASVDETTQFRRDVSKRPDPSSLEDYARVPVGEFGLAMLKGMGWKEGTSTSKRGRVGLVEAYVPQARPSLLGIGAKQLVLEGDGNAGGSGGSKDKKAPRPGRRYVPLLRKVIDHGRSEVRDFSDSASSRRSRSRSRSRSPPRRSNHRNRLPPREERDKYSSHNGHQRDHERSPDGRRVHEDPRHSRNDDRSSRRAEELGGEKKRYENSRSYGNPSGSDSSRARGSTRRDYRDDDGAYPSHR